MNLCFPASAAAVNYSANTAAVVSKSSVVRNADVQRESKAMLRHQFDADLRLSFVSAIKNY